MKAVRELAWGDKAGAGYASAEPFRVAAASVFGHGGAWPDWLAACQRALDGAGSGLKMWQASASAQGTPDIIVALSLQAAEAALLVHPQSLIWLLTDDEGVCLNLGSPWLAQISQGRGMGMSLWRLDPISEWRFAQGRSLHAGAETVYRRACGRIGPLLASLLQQAWRDHLLGVHTLGAASGEQPLQHPGRGSAAPWWLQVQGEVHAFWRRQASRWLSERWRVGIVDAPISAWLSPGFRPPIRWITSADRHRYHADPVGMIGSTRTLFCEEFDEVTGNGRLVRIELDTQGQVCASQALALDERGHVSFPQLLADHGRVLGMVESIASRACGLYEVSAQGSWQRLSDLLVGVAAVDPTLFRWEGRYWLAYTDADLGEQDNLCLRYADRLEGPWYPHANNPVRFDIRGARMAGAFFEHDGALYRPGQECLSSYGAAVVIHRVLCCTPTEYVEEAVQRAAPDAQGACPDGLHTLSSWGQRTLVDGKALSFSARAVQRKLRRRLASLMGSAPAPLPNGKPHQALKHVAVVVPHLRMGGGELSMLRVASGLIRLGVRVELIVNTLRTAELPVPDGVQVTELGCEGTLSSTKALAQALRQSGPQVVFSAFPHTNVATVAAARWAGVGTRCVVSEHAPLSLQIQREGGWRYRVLPPLVKWAYGRADAVVAVSQGVATDLQAMLGGRRPVGVIANPVIDDSEQLDRLADTGQPWLSDPTLQVVMSVSRLSVEKDIPTLLRAFALVHASRPQTRLMLVGEGPDRARLEALRTELGLDEVVQLPGRITQPRRWMQHAAVFALASQYEGFGNVLIEALSCGVPVVSTDCPVGPRDILADGRFGQLVPVADSQAMAAALMQALDQPQLPPGALAHAACFTESRSSQAYFQLFESLL